MRRAPTDVSDPVRVPPNQHLTPGFPVLHVEAPPTDTAGWSVTVSGRVHDRLVFALDELRDGGGLTATSDFHCVTGWSRLDNDWTGLPATDLLDRAGVRPEGSHVLAYGHPAYSANMSVQALRAPGVLVAWAHDGRPLDVAHGGPVRLVVPQRYGWKSVKWLTELRVVDRDVPGYWEERGYHMHADPWAEQRLAGD
nr:molybdopterin-dependent oxidoreductase [Salsipaludibacter albus]